MQFTIAGNTNPAAVAATVDSDGTLDLVFLADMSDSAEITVRATDPLGAYVEDKFTVTIVGPTFRVLSVTLAM